MTSIREDPPLPGNGQQPKDLVVLVSVFCLVFGILAVLLLASAVQRGATREIDAKILRSVRELAARKDHPNRLWGEESVIAVTSLGTIAILAGLCCAIMGFLLLTNRWAPSVLLLAALLGAIGLNYSLKACFDRARPDVVSHAQHVDTPSFPSGHALISTAVYATLGAIGANLVRDRRLKIYVISLAVALSLLIGLSRIYLGVHYPSDVLAGWTIGLLWATLCWVVARKLLRADARLG